MPRALGVADALSPAVQALLEETARRAALGCAAQTRARELLSAKIVPQYEALDRRVCAARD